MHSGPGRNFPFDRTGALLVLAAVLMVVVFAFTAFTIDVGYIVLTRNELQNAADAAALGACTELNSGPAEVRAAARSIAAANTAGGAPVAVPDADIDLGIFNFVDKSFTIDESHPNAVRVRTRVLNEPFFFAPVMGQDSFDATASAIAMLNPRDIVFVVDLSGSMNDDTEPCWATSVIESTFGPQGYSGVGTNLMQAIYDDFGFGVFPGAYQHIGEPLGVAQTEYAYAELTCDDGPLSGGSISSEYRILQTDDEATRKYKAYRWIIDNQIATLMPMAIPAPDSSVNYEYWEQYLDYVIETVWVGEPPPPSGGGGSGGSGGGTSGPDPPIGRVVPPARDPSWALPRLSDGPRPRSIGEVASTGTAAALHLLASGSAGSSTLPGVPRRGSNEWIGVPAPKDSAHEIDRFNNPNVYTFPSASTSLPDSWEFKIGYITYIQFMMDWGRDRKPDENDGTNASPAAQPKTPLSLIGGWCPLHTEVTAGGSFQFPPREQPMHAVRRSLIAAIQVVKERNAGLATGAGDYVAIVTYDAHDAYHQPQVLVPLTADYDAAMQACTQLQAVSDLGASTATEIGLRVARDHVRNVALGGAGRPFASKVVVLLTDGVPNVWESSQATVDTYISEHPNEDYYSSAYIWYNAALMQAAAARNEQIDGHPVGMGLGADYDFMDRMARFAGTDRLGLSARGSGNPAEYEQTLTDIISDIVRNPGSRLVQ